MVLLLFMMMATVLQVSAGDADAYKGLNNEKEKYGPDAYKKDIGHDGKQKDGDGKGKDGYVQYNSDGHVENKKKNYGQYDDGANKKYDGYNNNKNYGQYDGYINNKNYGIKDGGYNNKNYGQYNEHEKNKNYGQYDSYNNKHYGQYDGYNNKNYGIKDGGVDNKKN